MSFSVNLPCTDLSTFPPIMFKHSNIEFGTPFSLRTYLIRVDQRNATLGNVVTIFVTLMSVFKNFRSSRNLEAKPIFMHFFAVSLFIKILCFLAVFIFEFVK